jgi:outer membrane murein-binding lipoprotein Lpp
MGGQGEKHGAEMMRLTALGLAGTLLSGCAAAQAPPPEPKVDTHRLQQTASGVQNSTARESPHDRE